MNRVVQWVVAAVIAGTSIAPVVFAQEAQKSLPTLLIKGEVVSVDTADPSATLLKVKDRYGFETPIFLTSETKISSGGQAMSVADLKPTTAVEVEYNFDVNTAKRHAVNVAIGTAAPAAAPDVTASAPAAPAAPAEEMSDTAAQDSAPAATEAPAAPAASAQPAESGSTTQ